MNLTGFLIEAHSRLYFVRCLQQAQLYGQASGQTGKGPLQHHGLSDGVDLLLSVMEVIGLSGCFAESGLMVKLKGLQAKQKLNGSLLYWHPMSQVSGLCNDGQETSGC